MQKSAKVYCEKVKNMVHYIDEITNVYTLGATAFALFGEYNRTREKWQLSDKLFEIATRAVSDDRTKRQQSIRQFTAEWEAAQ